MVSTSTEITKLREKASKTLTTKYFSLILFPSLSQLMTEKYCFKYKKAHLTDKITYTKINHARSWRKFEPINAGKKTSGRDGKRSSLVRNPY